MQIERETGKNFAVLWILQFAGREHGTPCTVTQGKPRGPAQNTRGWEGECGKVPLLWFQWEGKGKAGRAGLGLADLNISRFWCIRAVPACLVPGPATVKVGLWWPGVWEPDKGGAWGHGLHQLFKKGNWPASSQDLKTGSRRHDKTMLLWAK